MIESSQFLPPALVMPVVRGSASCALVEEAPPYSRSAVSPMLSASVAEGSRWLCGFSFRIAPSQHPRAGQGVSSFPGTCAGLCVLELGIEPGGSLGALDSLSGRPSP